MNAEKMQTEVLACGDRSMLMRFCVDCGQLTGRVCDWCYTVDRGPKAEWAKGQHTPLSRSNSANSVIAQQCELVVRPGAVEHGRCDAETERGLMFQSTSNSADSSMNLSVDLAEQSASIEK